MNEKWLSSLELFTISTEDSIALSWDRLREQKDLLTYVIYVNEKIHGFALHGDYTIIDLEPETDYKIEVRAILVNHVEIDMGLREKICTKARSKVHNIQDYGALNDGKTTCTSSIQNAIDDCREGEVVYLPSGVYISGALFLHSNMTLRFEEGACLKGSENLQEYPLMNYRFEGLETTCYASLLNTKELVDSQRHKNICIEGKGTIDASGSVLRSLELADFKGKPGRAICLREVDGIYLKDITVRQSPAWCVHLIYCQDVTVNGISIHTRRDEFGNRYHGIANGDGLNPDSCKRVRIFNSKIASQDDCIAIKSGRDAEGRQVGISTEEVRITNCEFTSGFGVAIGSEMAAGVSKVLVEDCRFDGAYSVAAIKAPRGRGGIIESIIYRDISFRNYNPDHTDCKWFRGAIYIDQFYSHEEPDFTEVVEINEGTSMIRNILFENIVVDTIAGNAVYLSGLPERYLENIQMINIIALGKYGMKSYFIDGLRMDNVQIRGRIEEV